VPLPFAYGCAKRFCWRRGVFLSASCGRCRLGRTASVVCSGGLLFCTFMASPP
jgi:hypothetical protein